MCSSDLVRLREVELEIGSRRAEHQIDPTLDRIAALVSVLGDPHRAFPVVHVTGTNGKTSTTRMIESLLRERGLRTGRFTSPHLVSMRERICVDGEPLSAARFIEAYDEIRPYLQLVDDSHPVRLSFFEVFVGMAFAVFADAPVDVAVIEVGMGGTWDNTNVADGAVAIITPISIDHARHLGDTVEKIAADKAGIIKPGAIAVIGRQPPGAERELLRRAAEVGATVVREGTEFGVTSRELAVGGQLLDIRGLLGDYDNLFLPLFGGYQAGNAACALAAAEAFSGAPPVPGAAGQLSANGAAAVPGVAGDGQPGDAAVAADAAQAAGAGLAAGGDLAGGVASAQAAGPAAWPAPLDADLVRDAFARMSSPGRLETVRRGPVIILDSAHNPAGMAASAAALTEVLGEPELVVVIAVSGDKDVEGILGELEPVTSQLIVTANSSPRSMDPAKLADVAAGVYGEDRVTVADRLDRALDVAVTLADEAADSGAPVRPAILVTGSVITAGDARMLLGPGREQDDG